MMMQMFGSVFEPEKFPPIFDALGNEGGIEGVDIWRCAVPGQSKPAPDLVCRARRAAR